MAIKKLYITSMNPSEYILNLDMGRSGEWQGLTVFSMDGLGPPKATVDGVGGPNIDGILVTSVKTDARHMMLTLAVVPYAFGTEEEAKQKIYDAFPIKQEITVRIETWDDKDVYIMAIVESVEMNIFAKTENAVISLYCPEPYFLKMLAWQQISHILVVSPNDGEIVIGADFSITFVGTVDDGLTLQNGTGSQAMHIDFIPSAYTAAGIPPPTYMQSGDEIIIHTQVGQKSIEYIRSSTSYNFFNAVDQNADWIQLLLGNNSIFILCDNAPDSVEIDELKVTYRLQYEGI